MLYSQSFPPNFMLSSEIFPWQAVDDRIHFDSMPRSKVKIRAGSCHLEPLVCHRITKGPTKFHEIFTDSSYCRPQVIFIFLGCEVEGQCHTSLKWLWKTLQLSSFITWQSAVKYQEARLQKWPWSSRLTPCKLQYQIHFSGISIGFYMSFCFV